LRHNATAAWKQIYPPCADARLRPTNNIGRMIL
jgi:hypothetical protein